LPIEVLWPLFQLERKFVPHVCGEGHEVVEVVGREDSSDVGVGANVNRSYLVAAINEIGSWQYSALSQNFIKIEDNNAPAVVFQLQRHLGYEAVGLLEVFEQVAY